MFLRYFLIVIMKICVLVSLILNVLNKVFCFCILDCLLVISRMCFLYLGWVFFLLFKISFFWYVLSVFWVFVILVLKGIFFSFLMVFCFDVKLKWIVVLWEKVIVVYCFFFWVFLVRNCRVFSVCWKFLGCMDVEELMMNMVLKCVYSFGMDFCIDLWCFFFSCCMIFWLIFKKNFISLLVVFCVGGIFWYFVMRREFFLRYIMFV